MYNMWYSQSNIVPTTDASLSYSNSLTLTHISFLKFFSFWFPVIELFCSVWDMKLFFSFKRIFIDFWDEWIIWVFIIP